ncbi:hypothetical protein P152DRAFT_473131 [Eremomyces bilateralis CBS 781.70]|uniref:Uncharacterized protein n=1 Tax=Eremomyces bilateralis CBS 781.70 TaxID=1392243 RepID=A0A6G1G5R4_9PEZI|nr:uncharacterized protein P152DRAFT_473131 [Eremomyces bilateralis CBS 781.70]KAF1813403.1 hypothetical protein P152DRAFT_473131 [Eremomyces bilateralis CBS 781.70]
MDPGFRAVCIFSAYMLLAAGLSTRLIYLLSTQARRRARRLAADGKSKGLHAGRRGPLFGILTMISLATTWYYMFAFFATSYRAWAAHRGIMASDHPYGAQLALWLKESSLFKEAWGTALDTPGRLWWTQQIFSFTTAWSIFLGFEGESNQFSVSF